MIKKTSMVMLISIIIVGLVPISSFAQESVNEEFSENNQINSFIGTSIETGSAESGIITFSNKKGTKYEMKVYEMPGEKSFKKDNGEYQTTYVATSNQMQMVSEPMIGPFGSMTDDKWDPSISVHFYMKMNYKQNTVGNMCITSVTGRMVVSQSNLTISNQLVGAQCSNTAALIQQVERYYSTNSQRSFSFNTVFTKYAPIGNGYSSVGATWIGNITRGSKWSWNFVMPRGRVFMEKQVIYSGDSLENFLKVKRILKENNINYSDRIKRNGSWINFLVQLFTVGTGSYGMNDEHKQYYYVYVYSDDYDKVEELLNEIR